MFGKFYRFCPSITKTTNPGFICSAFQHLQARRERAGEPFNGGKFVDTQGSQEYFCGRRRLIDQITKNYERILNYVRLSCHTV